VALQPVNFCGEANPLGVSVANPAGLTDSRSLSLKRDAEKTLGALYAPVGKT